MTNARRLAAFHNARVQYREMIRLDSNLRAVIARDQLRPDRPRPSLPKLKSLEGKDDGA